MSVSSQFPNYSTFQAPGVRDWTGDNFLQAEGERWEDVKWMVVIGSFLAFMVAWGIGANDVANSFATSVGSKAIPMWGAVVLAGIFEFVGAISLGGSVSGTIKKGIARPDYFKDIPYQFAYGMMSALFSTWFWLTTATYLGYPVSTTHSIVGAMLGMGLVSGGNKAVIWNQETDEFPYRKGFTPIVISWFLGPVFTGIIASGIYIITRTLVLRRQRSTQFAYYCFPIVCGLTFFIVLLAILLKGVDEENLDWDSDKKAWVSIICGAGVAVVMIPVTKLLKSRLLGQEVRADAAAAAADAEAAHVAAGGVSTKKMDDEQAEANSRLGRFKNSWFGRLAPVAHITEAMTVDVHAHLSDEGREQLAQMHASAEVYDPRTENVFKYVQVVTASGVAFVHGANDVANAVGPLGGIWGVYTTYKSLDKAPTPRWVLAIGAIGIVVGLATWGYKMIQVLGTDLVHMTPARGYGVELGGVAIIALASVYGLPVSTTQVITGGVVGIGLCDDWRLRQVNWKIFGKTFTGWVFTIIITALVSATIYALGIYTPSRVNLDYINNYQWAMEGQMRKMLTQIQSEYCPGAGTVSGAPVCTYAKELETDLNNIMGKGTKASGFDEPAHVNQYSFIWLLQTVTGLFLDLNDGNANTLGDTSYPKNQEWRAGRNP